MSEFTEKVVKVVKKVPFGKVVSYGQVALYIGIPRAAHQVGWTLSRLGGKIEIPWWRVVNNKGRISIKGSKHSAADQAMLLKSEGLEITDDLTFDIEKYRFLPDKKTIDRFKLKSTYLELITQDIHLSKYFQNN